MRTVIFDLDGTLADTSGDLLAAANACFTGLGHTAPLDLEADQLVAFHGGRAMLRLGQERLGQAEDEAFIDAQFPELIQHYTDNIDVHTTIYPGCIEAVDDLLSNGIKVGVCTNKPEKQAEILLRKLGIRDRFASLIAADTLATRKPDAAPYVAAVEQAGGDVTRSLLVGDTVTDVKTAEAAGVPVVLVGFGPEGPGVARLTPDALLPSYDQLGKIVDVLIR